MRQQDYVSSERGTVRRTVDGYTAFHPEPLPRTVHLAPDLLKLLDEATGAVHRLGGIGRLLPNPHLLLGPHLRLEAVLSSRIEGTRTDVQELLRFEAGQAFEPALADDAREVQNYVLAMEHGLQRINDGFPLSVRLLREMHARLLDGVRGQHWLPGELRSSPNWIGGTTLENATFVPPPPHAMQEAMTDWERFLHEEDLPLLIQLALAHYQFEVIHPFLDGNGRIGRLLLPLMMVVKGAMAQPLLYLSAFFERHRSAYYGLLLATSQRGNLGPWLRFFLEGVRSQARDAEDRTVRLVELQHGMRSDLLADKQPNSVVRLGELLFSTPVVTAPQVEQALGVTRQTAQSAVRLLVDRGDLVEITGRERGRIYEAPKIFQAVYGDIELSDSTSAKGGDRQ